VYPHDHPGGFVAQQYVPENVKDHTYYEPTLQGYEREIRQRLRTWWEGVKRYAFPERD
jgi:putative ATPase